MCDHPNREQAMTVIARDSHGTPTIWCDPCIAPLIRALNDGGVTTVASCCGHGNARGWIMLASPDEVVGAGPVLEIYPDLATWTGRVAP